MAANGRPSVATTTWYLVPRADSSGRRNTWVEEVAMNRRKRRSDRSGRKPLPSPGRPPVAGREERRLFWAAIAAGASSEDAAASAGVPQAVGARWFRKAGGMAPAMFMASAEPLSGRYLSSLLSGSGVVSASRHQGGDEFAEEGSASIPGVVHELEEAEVEWQLFLRDAAVRPQPGAQHCPSSCGGR